MEPNTIFIVAVVICVTVVLIGAFLVMSVINQRLVDSLKRLDKVDTLLSSYLISRLDVGLLAVSVDDVPVKEHLEQLVVFKDAYDEEDPEHVLLCRTIRFIEKKLVENANYRHDLEALSMRIETMRTVEETRVERLRDVCEDFNVAPEIVHALGLGA